jgi:mercuric ion binding protein
MMKLSLLAAVSLTLLPLEPAFAGEASVTLAVKNMTCALCPYTVKSSLEAVPGVKQVVVSFKEKTAVVTYENEKTNLQALTAATTNAGYPSSPMN